MHSWSNEECVVQMDEQTHRSMEKINKPQVYTHQVWPADFILCNKSRSKEEVLSFQQMMLKQKDTQFQKGGKKKTLRQSGNIGKKEQKRQKRTST